MDQARILVFDYLVSRVRAAVQAFQSRIEAGAVWDGYLEFWQAHMHTELVRLRIHIVLSPIDVHVGLCRDIFWCVGIVGELSSRSACCKDRS